MSSPRDDANYHRRGGRRHDLQRLVTNALWIQRAGVLLDHSTRHKTLAVFVNERNNVNGYR